MSDSAYPRYDTGCGYHWSNQCHSGVWTVYRCDSDTSSGGDPESAACVVFIIVLQQVDGNIIGPKILGDSTGLSAFWVMFSILIGGGLFGFLGMLLGVPVFAMIYYIIRRLVNHSIRKKNLTTVTEAYVEAAGVDEATGAIIYYGEKQKKKRTLKDSGKKDETKKNQ